MFYILFRFFFTYPTPVGRVWANWNIFNGGLMQVQNMNLKLNMKDINKILAKALFKCIFF
jgi:hypothetical protein